MKLRFTVIFPLSNKCSNNKKLQIDYNKMHCLLQYVWACLSRDDKKSTNKQIMLEAPVKILTGYYYWLVICDNFTKRKTKIKRREINAFDINLYLINYCSMLLNGFDIKYWLVHVTEWFWCSIVIVFQN